MFKILFKCLLTLIAFTALIVLWQQDKLYALALQRIDPVPTAQAMIDEKHYVEAASYLEFFLTFDYVKENGEAQQLYEDIMAERSRWGYKFSKIGEGLWRGTSDETIGQVTGIATDFLVIGDIRDLSHEGWNLVQGEEVDEVLVALSSLGLAASGAQVVSGFGTAASAGAASPTLVGSTVAKSSLITLKTARKLGKLPKWLNKAIIDAAKTVKQSKSFGALGNMLEDIATLAKTRGGLELLSNTTDAKSLKNMAKFANNFDKHGVTIYRIGGDLAVNTARKVGKANQQVFEQAVSFGESGLRTLNKIGPKRFAKVALLTRTGKVVYKGDLSDTIANMLNNFPHWLLWLLAASGILVWLPSLRNGLKSKTRHPKKVS